jgi:epoxyqueuosine reductase QueG
MKYEGMLRNVCTAMGNSGNPEYRPALERLSQHEDAAVREHALWALARFDETKP